MSGALLIGGVFLFLIIIIVAIILFSGIGRETKNGPSPSPSPSPSRLPSPSPSAKNEVFYITGSEANPYTFTKDTASAACTAAGAKLATADQLKDAHTAGADWCATGWLAGTDGASYPITTRTIAGCSTTPNVIPYIPPNGLAGATCYGKKPTQSANPRVLPFNEDKWSKYDVQSGPSKEVFYIKGTEANPYTLNQNDAGGACASVGARLASLSQLNDAYTKGANWCATGWLDGTDGAAFPITTQLVAGCSTTPQVVRWTPDGGLAGATCYGVKPTQGSNARIMPFNESKWSLST